MPFTRNMGTLTSWKPLGPSGPLTGLLYLYLTDTVLTEIKAVEFDFGFIRLYGKKKNTKCFKHTLEREKPFLALRNLKSTKLVGGHPAVSARRTRAARLMSDTSAPKHTADNLSKPRRNNDHFVLEHHRIMHVPCPRASTNLFSKVDRPPACCSLAVARDSVARPGQPLLRN